MDYNNRIEQEKMDQLKSMKLHCQFGRDTDDKNQEIHGTGTEMEI